MAHKFNQVVTYSYIRFLTTTSDYTILPTDNEEIFVYTGDDSGGNNSVTITLPANTAVPIGRKYIIIEIGAFDTFCKESVYENGGSLINIGNLTIVNFTNKG